MRFIHYHSFLQCTIYSMPKMGLDDAREQLCESFLQLSRIIKQQLFHAVINKLISLSSVQLLLLIMIDNNQDPNSNRLSTMPINHYIDLNTLAEISNALLNISNPAFVQTAQSTIKYFQTQNSYVVYLLEIINTSVHEVHNHMNEMLLRSALIQLKVYIRKAWSGLVESVRMNELDQEYFIKSIVRTSFNISSILDPRLQVLSMKLLKDVIEITCHDSIKILPEVVDAIKMCLHSQHTLVLLPVYLNIILGLINNLSNMLREDVSMLCIAMLRQIHPLLLEFTKQGEMRIQQLYNQLLQSEFHPERGEPILLEYQQFKRRFEGILYLIIKLFYRALNIKDLFQVKEIFLDWLTIAINRITYVDPTFTHPRGQQQHLIETGIRGTDEFNYFHGKKWAMKLLRCSMEKLLVYKSRSSQTGRMVIKFYQQNLSEIIEHLKKAWEYEWPQKIKCELLRTMCRTVKCQPQRLVKDYEQVLHEYLETILPAMMDLSNEKSIIEDSPGQFIVREDEVDTGDNIYQYQSSRLAAIKLWLTIAKIQFIYDKQCKDSKILRKSLMIIYTWLHTLDRSTLHLRDIGCFLLTKLRLKLEQVNEYDGPLHNLVNSIIQENLNICEGEFFMILVRALELAINFDSFLNPTTTEIIRRKVIDIFTHLDLDKPIKHNDLITLIRSSQVIHIVLRIQARQGILISAQDTQIIINKVFKLVESTSNEEFIVAANQILQVCINHMGDYSKQIANTLRNWFRIYMDKDLVEFKTTPALEYKQNYMQIARGIIIIFETIMKNLKKQDDPQVHQIIDQEVINIITYILTEDAISREFIDDGLYLLKAYLSHHDTHNQMNPEIQMLCQIMILRMAGLPLQKIDSLKQMQAQCQTHDQRWKQLQLYINCYPKMCDGFKSYVGFSRLFVKHMPFGQEIRNSKLITREILNVSLNHTELMIYLVSRFYSSADPKRYTYNQNGKCISLLMLIYYYEHHQSAQCNNRIHSSVNSFTLQVMMETHHQYSIRSQYAKYNSQLFCLWVHELQENTPNYLQIIDQEELTKFLSQVLIYDYQYGLGQLHYYEQNIRCTFGLSTLIRIGITSQGFWNLIPLQIWGQIISFAIQFAYKSTQQYAEDQSDFDIYEEDEEQSDEERQRYIVDTEEEVGNKQKIGYEPKMIGAYRVAVEKEEDQYDHEQYNSENENDGYSQNCWNYEEVQDSPDATPLQSHDDGVYLLTTLFELYRANSALYYKIIDEQLLAPKIKAILNSSQCHSNPQRRHFLVLYSEQPDSDQQ